MSLDEREVRMRCLEAAARAGVGATDPQGPAAGVKQTAAGWADWVLAGTPPSARVPLGLPKKS